MIASCPHCGTRLNVKGFSPGAQVKCSTCENIFTLSETSSLPAEQTSPYTTHTKTNQSRTRSAVKARYPNLTRYLSILRMLVNIIFCLSIVAELVFGVLTLSGGIYLGAEGFVILRIVILILAIAFTYLWRIISLAGIEFIQVIVDIESNTRKMVT